MIVGQNGCGKTTIIECLKYITTGTLPPGCKNGQSFINDPTMTDSTEVKASIKLRYVSSSGVDCVTSRTMSLIKKKTKMEFKSLDGTVKTVNENGEKVSLTYKCGELDKYVSESLGVTTPILESVIFCHQEDSSWPMQDSKTLKMKLDDIFESTRYTKALDAFQKSKKDFVAKAKELKSQQTELAAHMSAANLYLNELSDCQENEAQCNDRLKDLDEQVQRAESKAQRFRENLQRLEGSKAELTQLQLKIDEHSRRISEYVEKLTSDGGKEYSESDEALANLLQDFDNKMQEKEKGRRDLQRTIDTINNENNHLRDEADDLNVKRGMVESLKSQYDGVVSKFNDQTRKVGQKYSLSPAGAFFEANAASPEKVFKAPVAKDFMNKLNSKITEMQQDVDSQISVLKQQVADQEKIVSDVRSLSQRHELDLENKTREIAKLTQETSLRQNGLSTLAVSKDNLASLRRDYDADLQQLQAMKATNQAKTEEYKRKQRDISDEIRGITDDYQRDADTLQSLSMRRAEILQNEAAERQVNMDEEQILSDLGVFFRNNNEVLENAILPNTPDSLDDVLRALEQRGQDRRRDLSVKKKDTEEMIRKSATSEALLSELKKKLSDEKAKQYSLRNTRAQFLEIVAEIRDMCKKHDSLLAGDIDNVDFDIKEPSVAACEQMKPVVRSLVKMSLSLASFRLMCDTARRKAERNASKFLKTLKEAPGSGSAAIAGACPCCAQVLRDGEAVAAAKITLDKIIGSVILKPEEEEDFKSKVDKISDAMNCIEEPVRALTDLITSIQDLEAKISTIEGELGAAGGSAVATNKLKDDIQNHEIFITQCDKAHSTLQELKLRWQGIRSRKKECEEKKRNIHSSQFGADTGGRSIETIEQEQQDRVKRKEALQMEKDKIVKEESEYLKRFYVVNASVTDKEKALNDANKKNERYADEKKAIDALQKQLNEAQQSKQLFSSQRDETAREISSKQSDLTEKKNRLDDAQSSGRIKLDEIRTLRDQLQETTTLLGDTQAKLSSCNPAAAERRLTEIQKLINDNQERSGQVSSKMQEISKALMNQEVTKRTVRDNMELRQRRRDLATDQDRMGKLREARGLGDGQKVNELARDLQRAEQEKNQASNGIATERGKLSIYEQQLRDIRTKLNGPNYKDVKQKHRRKAIEAETTEMAVRDLESYYNAL
jgi:DNA repair protein RAD50